MNAAEKKQLLSKYEAIFTPFIGKELRVSFGPHTFSVIFECVRLATQKQLQNTPDKRTVDNKERTPQVIQFCFEGDNTLDFVLDDITAAHSTIKGAEIVIGELKVMFQC